MKSSLQILSILVLVLAACVLPAALIPSPTVPPTSVPSPALPSTPVPMPTLTPPTAAPGGFPRRFHVQGNAFVDQYGQKMVFRGMAPVDPFAQILLRAPVWHLGGAPLPGDGRVGRQHNSPANRAG